MITFRYRVKPTRVQGAILDRHLETCRQLYNRLLEELNRARDGGRLLSKATAQAFLPVWKTVDFPELGEVYSKVAQMVVYQLYANVAGLAAKKGRGHKVGRLRYKGGGYYTSLNYNQSGFKIDRERGTIRLAKVGVVRARFHRDLPLSIAIKGIIIKKNRTGKWFACIQCSESPRTGDLVETALASRLANLDSGGHAVGIDLGITHFAADSGSLRRESGVPRSVPRENQNAPEETLPEEEGFEAARKSKASPRQEARESGQPAARLPA